MTDLTPSTARRPRGAGPRFTDAFRALPEVPSLSDLIPIGDAKKQLRWWVDEISNRVSDPPPASPRAATQLESALVLLRQAGNGVLLAVRVPDPPLPEPPARSMFGRVRDYVDDGTKWIAADPRGEPVPPRAPETTVSLTALRNHVLALCEELDRMLACAEPPPPERVFQPWAEDRDLVRLLQDLLHGWHMGHGARLMSTVDTLAQQLPARHGIQVSTSYDDNTSGWFEVAPPPADRTDDRPRVVRVVRPALVHRGEVKARGEAVEEFVDEPGTTGIDAHGERSAVAGTTADGRERT